METWKPLHVCADYEVSDLGRIRRVRAAQATRVGHIKGAYPNNSGYLLVGLMVNKKQKTYMVHRLVMAAFHGVSELHVNHKNGNKRDNRLCNLEYVTQLENTRHAKETLGAYLKGTDNPNSKMTPDKVRLVRNMWAATPRHTQRDIAKVVGCSQRNVLDILKGRIWTHV